MIDGPCLAASRYWYESAAAMLGPNRPPLAAAAAA